MGQAVLCALYGKLSQSKIQRKETIPSEIFLEWVNAHVLSHSPCSFQL